MTATTDLLRRAAQVARETAQAATRGPWTAEEHRTAARLRSKLAALGGQAPLAFWAAEVHPVVELEGDGGGGVATAADAHHIALWQPDVALAVAAWLEAAAELHPPSEDGWGDDHASRVASALLREGE